jgi:hypothetical protein
MGIKSELGRTSVAGRGGRGCNEFPGLPKIQPGDGHSIFDPCLAELAYTWFCPAGGQIIDPFAGGSVRGIVAGALGFDYWGCDLRHDQVLANRDQAQHMSLDRSPQWVQADAIDAMDIAPEADFLFSCPPYGDLEVYSDDPRDLSTMEYHTFTASLGRIILKATRRLKPDRFAAFVVGDFRDRRRGFLRGFTGKTIELFAEAGLSLYNDGVLVNAVGTGCMRASRQFFTSRKLVKLHQNLLVFCNGDPERAAAACRKPGESAEASGSEKGGAS